MLANAGELAEVLDTVFNIEPPGPVDKVFAKIVGACAVNHRHPPLEPL